MEQNQQELLINKRGVTQPDGRYLIFYTFNELRPEKTANNHPEEAQPTLTAAERAMI